MAGHVFLIPQISSMSLVLTAAKHQHPSHPLPASTKEKGVLLKTKLYFFISTQHLHPGLAQLLASAGNSAPQLKSLPWKLCLRKEHDKEMGELLLEPSQCWLQWQELVTLHTQLRTAWTCSDGPLLLLSMRCPLAPEREGWARKGSCWTIPREKGQEMPLKRRLLLRAQEQAAIQCICPPSLEGRALHTGSPQQPCTAPSVSWLAQGTQWHWLRHCPCPVS